MTIYLENHKYSEDCFYCTQDNEFESVHGFVAEFGQWHAHWIYLRNGIELAFSTDQYSDLVIEGSCSGQSLVLQFCLSGGIRISAPPFPDTVDDSVVSANSHAWGDNQVHLHPYRATRNL